MTRQDVKTIGRLFGLTEEQVLHIYNGARAYDISFFEAYDRYRAAELAHALCQPVEKKKPKKEGVLKRALMVIRSLITNK